MFVCCDVSFVRSFCSFVSFRFLRILGHYGECVCGEDLFVFCLVVVLVDQGSHPVQNILPNGGCEPRRMLYVLAAHFEQLHLLLGDLGVHRVDRLGVVVQAGRLQDDQTGAHHARYREDPQEQTI